MPSLWPVSHQRQYYLMRHLAKHNILAGNQHAFRKHSSCESQLILTTNDLAKNLNKNITTDMAVLDFEESFSRDNMITNMMFKMTHQLG